MEGSAGRGQGHGGGGYAAGDVIIWEGLKQGNGLGEGKAHWLLRPSLKFELAQNGEAFYSSVELAATPLSGRDGHLDVLTFLIALWVISFFLCPLFVSRKATCGKEN